MYTKEELNILLVKAHIYVCTCKKLKGLQCRRIEWFYRDKTLLDLMYAQIDGTMTKYGKDDNGDPESPINNRLHGLHFSVNVDFRTNKPMPYSVYGDTRLLIPAEYMLDECPRLYFADFFCLRRGIHHITLVLTKPGSKSDRFCSRYLPRLNLTKNLFLCRVTDAKGNTYVEVLNNGIWIEVFFTESVDMKRCQGQIQSVQQRCRRTGPRPKDESCQSCNLRLTELANPSLVVEKFDKLLQLCL
ncbi:hypothetical protein CAPTEDRAFT_192475 [Capitella teleta]|uniref:Phytanoyl-CoA hydroxylase-interacting protein-like C-terminal domain-containing protein n=1 Tax=Capitella teleta TaxID=283909 RepID=R7U318_CAPTE|nr:hypothetical protein CAPTEDRAFT_192475 [Capitella teleta]|eukprot:ELU00379.1 hypothetical protein CAPTEDRAFT_192475 [Capitella teleta]